mmetsp:Transcript_18138/g.50445  ORF Transcript_18138/g.50445 Transcript_18138/m.50445 type:complete len:130 (-) Transcript_18138:428-817(-)
MATQIRTETEQKSPPVVTMTKERRAMLPAMNQRKTGPTIATAIHNGSLHSNVERSLPSIHSGAGTKQPKHTADFLYPISLGSLCENDSLVALYSRVLPGRWTGLPESEQEIGTVSLRNVSSFDEPVRFR